VLLEAILELEVLRLCDREAADALDARLASHAGTFDSEAYDADPFAFLIPRFM
jgi:hypothetical protein